jgi:hypothetical protein
MLGLLSPPWRAWLPAVFDVPSPFRGLAGVGLAFGVGLVEVELDGDDVAAPLEPAGDDAVLLAEPGPLGDGALPLDGVEPVEDGAPLPVEVEAEWAGAAGLLEPVEDGALPLVELEPLAADALPPVAVEPA